MGHAREAKGGYHCGVLGGLIERAFAIEALWRDGRVVWMGFPYILIEYFLPFFFLPGFT